MTTKPIFIMFNFLIITMIVSESKFFVNRDAEIDGFLNKLNKPAVKSIKSPDGDIIDCVHIKNHPIYDHPLFKNHTIQMRPSSYPKGWINASSNNKGELSMVTQLWTLNGRCPKNSIPIRRTRREDILRAGSIKGYMKKFPDNIPEVKHEYAEVVTFGKFNGGRALVNVWKPLVQKNEFSLAQIWVAASAPNSKKNTIEAGWQVYQKYYGDSNPHYFIYWTADGYQETGCYNLDCPGFVLVNRNFAIGAAVKDISTIGGPQYHIPTTIWRDLRSGHWWLKFGHHTLVGYWPSSLFNLLKNGATEVVWGGEIIDTMHDSKHTKTIMGSGRFAQEGYQKASYFKNVEVITENEIPQQPVKPYPVMTQKNCYNVNLDNHLVWGTFFYYGGPGQNPNCR